MNNFKTQNLKHKISKIKSLAKQNFMACIVIAFLFLLCFSFSLNPSFAIWNNVKQSFKPETLNVLVGEFLLENCCYEPDIVIDGSFFDNYMELDQNGNYDWKRDKDGNIINLAIIKDLTKVGTTIKTDTCYLVLHDNYNIIDHGFPQLNSPLGWALIPISINYVNGWTYFKNRVVKTSDGNFYMARWELSTNPLTDQNGWDKIEPVLNSDFNTFENSIVPNYGSPIMSQIVRFKVWDSYTKYLVGDLVTHLNISYTCIIESVGAVPENSPWAWELS